MQYQILPRNLIKITGPDKFKLLQGLITKDINLVVTQPIYALMLSPQGRFLFDFFIYLKDEDIYLSVHESRFDICKSKLQMYKLRSQVEITPISLYCIYSTEILKDTICSFKDPRLDQLGYISFVSNKPSFGQSDIYTKHKYEYIIPDAEAELIYEKTLPQEVGIDFLCGIDYNKGCYVGQEVIMRTKTQGVVRKRLVKIIADSDLESKEGEIVSNSNKVGKLLSVNGNMGMAVIKIAEIVEDQTYLTTDSTSVKVNIILPAWYS